MSTPETSTELEVIDAQAAPTVFRTEEPMEVMKRTAEVANGLREFVAAQGLTVSIQGREYLKVEAWQMLGLMLGVTPAHVTTEPVEDGWQARVELHDRTGRLIASGEAECLTAERRWKTADDYARRSMAQTRAIGKAYRNAFGFIAAAAGYEATPAEEMPRPEDVAAQTARPRPTAQGQASEPAATAKQRGLINAKAAEKGLSEDQLADIILEASGADPIQWSSPEHTRDWLGRALDRLPARLVDPVLEGIANGSVVPF